MLTCLKFCKKCNTEKHIDAFYKNRRSKDGYGAYCKMCQNKMTKHWNSNNPQKRKTIKSKCRKKLQIKRKIEVLTAYSHRVPKCVCCGEKEITFLSLDHSKNDGSKHRKVTGEGQDLYFWLEKHSYPKNLGLRILCFNCNLGRQINGGNCPHEECGLTKDGEK